MIIEMDANSKLGPKYIPEDPHGMTPNGALLAGIIDRHNLIVGNGSNKCKGVITRKRVTKERTEKSVIDLLLFSSDLSKHFVSLNIDEEKKHVITKCINTRKGIKVKESDHNVLISEFKCNIKDDKGTDKIEIYNLKNRECQLKFKKYTDETTMLSSSVDEEGDINQVIKRFMKKLNGSIAHNFKKVRVNKHKDNPDDKFFDRRRLLKNKEDDRSKQELEQVNKAIADKHQENFERLKAELAKVKTVDGKINSKQLWKMKRKLCPQSRDAPSAMKDAQGNLITSDKAILKRASEVYANRLKGNVIKAHLKTLETDTNDLCEIRIKLAKNNTSEPWSMSDLKEVLKNLGNDKCRDPEGMVNEIFKEAVAGSDLLEAVLKLMNMMKKKQEYPKILEKCNITSIHKKKSKKEFENYRGVFRVQILRSILDRLIYNDSYYTIDSTITDGNVGGRKSRSVRDNIFVISAVINSVKHGESGPIQVQVMDAEKCFDKLWLQSCINALYEAGITNDHLNMLYIEKRNAQIAVKINDKLSSRISVQDVIMQGSCGGV